MHERPVESEAGRPKIATVRAFDEAFERGPQIWKQSAAGEIQMTHDRSGTGVMDLSRAHGFVAKLFYLMQTTPVRGLDAVFASLPAHLQYWVDLEKRGVLLAGGPLLPEDLSQDYKGDGLVVFRAGSLEEAQHISAQDPMHLSGARQFTVTPWLVNHLNLSG